MPNPVVHFEVLGRDAAKLQSFYADLFQWSINADNPMNYGTVDNGGDGINGGIGPSPSGPAVTFYVQVDDPQAYLDRAEKLGGTTVIPVSEVPGAGVTLAQFSDPDGNVIGLVKG